jgi:hypothetical protein
MTTSKREFILQMAYFAIGGGVGFVSRNVVWNGHEDRRFVLYNIMKELRKEMARSEVEAIISRHAAPFIDRYEKEDRLTLTVWLSTLRALYLMMSFSGQKLTRAEFVGVDSPQDVPRDAPPPLV